MSSLIVIIVSLMSAALPTASAPAIRQPPITTPDGPENARCAEWWSEARDVGWPEQQLPTLDRVMWCESHCQPDAYNRSGASGLMQVLKSHAPNDDLFDPVTNLTVALDVWERQGWHAWSCY